MRQSVALLAVTVAAVSAQSLGNISQSCQTAAGGLLTGGGLASCTNLLQLVSIATGSGSIVDGVQTYVQGLCTQAPCSTDTITTARNTIQQGCASDIQSGSELPVALNAILGNYNDTRALLCSQNSSNGTYCVPTTLRAVEQASGQRLSISSVTGLVSGDGLGDLLQNTPNSAVCTDCGKAIVSLGSRIVANVSQSGQSSVESAAGQKCGGSFGDGQIPASISTSGSASQSGSSSSGSSSGAVSTIGSGPIVALAGVSTAIVVGALTLLA